MLPEDNFSIRRNAKDGLQYLCKDCLDKNQKERYLKSRKLKIGNVDTEMRSNYKVRIIKVNPTGVYKKCNRCKKLLDYAYFCIKRATKDGYHTACKSCINKYQIEFRARAKARKLKS